VRADLRALRALLPRVTPEELIEIKQRLRGIIHGTLHDTVCGHKFEQIRTTIYAPIEPPLKRRRTEGDADVGSTPSSQSSEQGLSEAAASSASSSSTIPSSSSSNPTPSGSGDANDPANVTLAATTTLVENEPPPPIVDGGIESDSTPTVGTSIKRTHSEVEKERCTICLMDYEEGEEIKHLSCQHMFHTACLRTWFKSKANCPFCRQCALCGRGDPFEITFVGLEGLNAAL